MKLKLNSCFQHGIKRDDEMILYEKVDFLVQKTIVCMLIDNF